MSSTVRRALAAVVIVLSFGVAAVVSAQHRGHLMTAARSQAQAEAERSWVAQAEALKALSTPLAARANRVAMLENLTAIFATTTSHSDLKAVAATLEDARATEDWLRTPLAGSEATFFIGRDVVTTQSPELVRAFEGLLDAAEVEPTGALVAGDKRVVLLGLARTRVENLNGRPAFVGLARSLMKEDLGAPQAGRAVQVFLDGDVKGAISAGSADGVAKLERRRISMKLDESPCCVTRALAPGVTMSLFEDPERTLEAARAEATRAQWPRFAVAGVVCLVVVALLLLAGRRSDADAARDALLRETQAQLRQSHEALQKLSTGAFATQAANGAQPAPGLDQALASTQASVSASRYEVIAPLGEGGMAKVFVAVVRGAEGFKRTFVVKRLKADHAGNEELVNQFIDEARLGASLVHSNIVPVFDFGRDAEGYFLAQEYILGRDVEALVDASMQRRGRPLEPALVATIGQEALKALAYAHGRTDASGKEAGLVHRDVSPANLMVSRRGEVKLLDFGIVKSADRVTKTQAGVVKGNLFYMSPEQARALPVDFRSDLFSLGMVLAYAALGRHLYTGETMFELMNRAAAGPTPADLDVVRAGAGPLSTFLLKALAIDPALRFQTAGAMATALAEVVPAAPSMALEALMLELFRDDLEAERQRFAGGA